MSTGIYSIAHSCIPCCTVLRHNDRHLSSWYMSEGTPVYFNLCKHCTNWKPCSAPTVAKSSALHQHFILQHLLVLHQLPNQMAPTASANRQRLAPQPVELPWHLLLQRSEAPALHAHFNVYNSQYCIMTCILYCICMAQFQLDSRVRTG